MRSHLYTVNNTYIEKYLDLGRYRKNYKENTLPYSLFSQREKNSAKKYLIDSNRQLTFHETAVESLKIASYLKHFYPGETVVGIYAEPSVEMALGIWGTLASGCAYLPLSLEYPEDRLQYMIDNTFIKIIFSSRNSKHKLESLDIKDIKVFCLEDVELFLTRYVLKDTDYDYCCTEEHLAYLIYTSGSTGLPKGVMIEHKSITHQMEWLLQEHEINENTRILHKTPISFDAAQWEILAGCNGSEVIIGPINTHKDPDKIISLITKYNINTLQGVPTLLQSIAGHESFTSCTTLTKIFSGGEALTQKLAGDIFSSLTEACVINLYGPTECTINITSQKIYKKHLKIYGNAIPIGSIVAGHHFLILSSDGKQCITGETGELYLSGPQISKGYFNNNEQTKERFVTINNIRYYKTGDLVFVDKNGLINFTGRADNQIKLRGYRLELDEVRINIEKHPWVKHAAVSVVTSSSSENLAACIELNHREATLMDHGIDSFHHTSKSNKLQVKSQLASPGCKQEEEIKNKECTALPSKYPDEAQTEKVFARKSYRFYEGSPASRKDVLHLLNVVTGEYGESLTKDSTELMSYINFQDLGYIMRYFGAFYSSDRLLPKYGYASPGALYATQIFLEITNFASLKDGFYYYHPLSHQLMLIYEHSRYPDTEILSGIELHFIGKKNAIEPVYKNNIIEVLEFETGHILGLFDDVLKPYQLVVGRGSYKKETAVYKKIFFECSDEDYYIASYPIHHHSFQKKQKDQDIDILVQFNKNSDPENCSNQVMYRYSDGNLIQVSGNKIEKKDVIAINQRVYEQSEIGICLISRSESWDQYIELGRLLQAFQMNDFMFGFMSSGYSSKTNNDLQAAKKIKKLFNLNDNAAVYFALGGKISPDQKVSRDMKEDSLHISGPAEIIKQELAAILPDYMIPNRIIILNTLPKNHNGKIDLKKVQTIAQNLCMQRTRSFITPKNKIEQELLSLWIEILKTDDISVNDDFFDLGGDSLSGVLLINSINKKLGCSLPLQILFDAKDICSLSKVVNDDLNIHSRSRMIRLNTAVEENPIICWPGLGGYPLNLRNLGKSISEQPVYAFQAHGINNGETPFSSLEEMALEDIKVLKKKYPEGPYTLIGYSFGAKLAYETAFQLEAMNDTIKELILIAPGSPLHKTQRLSTEKNLSFENPYFIVILYSVFTHSIIEDKLNRCLAEINDKEGFIRFIHDEYPELSTDTITRIVNIVETTYHFTCGSLFFKKINAPIFHIKARGDDESFIEKNASYLNKITFLEAASDHYSILKKEEILELLNLIHHKKK